MNRVAELKQYSEAFKATADGPEQRFLLRMVLAKSALLGDIDLREYLLPEAANVTGSVRSEYEVRGVQCPHCDRNDFKNQHALRAHVGMKHKR